VPRKEIFRRAVRPLLRLIFFGVETVSLSPGRFCCSFENKKRSLE